MHTYSHHITFYNIPHSYFYKCVSGVTYGIISHMNLDLFLTCIFNCRSCFSKGLWYGTSIIIRHFMGSLMPVSSPRLNFSPLQASMLPHAICPVYSANTSRRLSGLGQVGSGTGCPLPRTMSSLICSSAERSGSGWRTGLQWVANLQANNLWTTC